MRLAVAIAIIAALGNADFDRAQQIARGRESERAKFHSGYSFPLKDPTVTQIDVVTEFRRAVMITEEHLRRGDWLFSRSVASVEAALRPTRAMMTLTASLRFHPQNALVTIPMYELAIGQAMPMATLVPIPTQTTSSYSLPFKTPEGDRTSLVGAQLMADVTAASVGQTTRPVGVVLDGREVARVSIDFRRLD